MPTRLSIVVPLCLLALVASGDEGLVLDDCRLLAGAGLPSVKASCGYLRRPENPELPDGRSISLRVAVVPALSVEPMPDPLVVLAGGPGQAATELYVAYRGAFERVRRERPILLVDQRGTGDSAPLTCESGEGLLEETHGPEQIAPLVRSCLEDLEADPRFYTTSVAVEDLEAVRATLDYPLLNLYGVSYGTRVAQHYLRRFPDRTRTVILDGVVPAGVALGPEIALFAQDALEAVFRRCEESPTCNEEFPDLESQFEQLRSRLQEEPVRVDLIHPVAGEPTERRFSEAGLASAVRLLTYSPSTAALLPHLIREAASGNMAPIAAQAMMIEATLNETLAIGMHNSVVCTEDLPFIADASIDRPALAATYMGETQIDTLAEICRHWPRGVMDPGLREPLSSEVPVLILSGEYDPVTPPAWGDIAARQFDQVRHLVGPGQGHGLAPWGCTPRLVAEFVDTASVEALDAGCISRMHPMPFFVDFNGPAP